MRLWRCVNTKSAALKACLDMFRKVSWKVRRQPNLELCFRQASFGIHAVAWDSMGLRSASWQPSQLCNDAAADLNIRAISFITQTERGQRKAGWVSHKIGGFLQEVCAMTAKILDRPMARDRGRRAL